MSSKSGGKLGKKCKVTKLQDATEKLNAQNETDKKLADEFKRLSHLFNTWAPQSEDQSRDKPVTGTLASLPWDSSTRLAIEKQIKDLEKRLLLTDPRSVSSSYITPACGSVNQNKIDDALSFHERLRRHEDKLTLWKNVEYKVEKAALEKQIAHYQTECEVQCRRYKPCIEQNLPQTLQDLVTTFESMNSNIRSMLATQNKDLFQDPKTEATNICCSEAIKEEIKSPALNNATGKYAASFSYMCVKKEKFQHFYDQQERILRLLAKYCKLLFRQSKIGTALSQGVIAIEDCSALNESMTASEEIACSIFSSPERGPTANRSIMDQSYLDHEARTNQITSLNKLYGELLDRRTKQVVSAGALHASINQINKDLRAHSIDVNKMKENGQSDRDQKGQLESSVKKTDWPTPLQLRSQILHLKERQQSLKEGVCERLQNVRVLTNSIADSCNYSQQNISAEDKREKLQYFVDQQQKVITYLEAVRLHEEAAKSALCAEKASIKKQCLHVQSVLSEVKDLDEFCRNVREDLKRMQFSGHRRQRLTVSHKDDFAQLVSKILSSHFSKSVDLECKEAATSSGYCGIKREPNTDLESLKTSEFSVELRDDKENWPKDEVCAATGKQIFKKEPIESMSRFEASDLMTYDDLVQFASNLAVKCEDLDRELKSQMAKDRKHLINFEDNLSCLEQAAIGLDELNLDRNENLLSFNKDLNRIELQLASFMEQWAVTQRRWASNPVEKMERDAFVDFFLHPAKTALSIARWKNEKTVVLKTESS